MPSDRTINIPLVPRTTANCLDLAMRYCGRNLPQVLSLWLMMAVPACATVYSLSTHSDFGLRMALAVYWFATLPLGMLLVADVAGHTFGGAESGDEPRHGFRPFSRVPQRIAVVGLPLLVLLALAQFDRSLGLRLSRSTQVLLNGVVFGATVVLVPTALALNQRHRLRAFGWGGLVTGTLARCVAGFGPALVVFGEGGWILLGLMLSLFPGAWVAVRFGFVIERATLRRLDPRLHDDHISRVLATEVGDLAIRGGTILLLGSIVFLVLAFTAEYAATLLTGRARLTERVSDLEALGRYLTLDPYLLTALTAVALLAYPVGRLAWFFCYVDARVRRDCWDMELQLAEEAERLEPPVWRDRDGP